MTNTIDKCSYRLHIDELLSQDRDIPKLLGDCEECDGYYTKERTAM